MGCYHLKKIKILVVLNLFVLLQRNKSIVEAKIFALRESPQQHKLFIIFHYSLFISKKTHPISVN